MMNTARSARHVLLWSFAAALLAGCSSPGGTRATKDSVAITTEAGTSAENIFLSQVREQALSLLAQAGSSDDAEERYNSIEALLPVPSRLEPAVRRGLMDPDDRVRIVAAMAVGKARLTRLVPFVRALLDDKSEMVRAAAVFAVFKCGDENVSQQALGSLLQHPRPLFRAHAAWLLGEMGNPSALPMIRDAARDPMPRADQAQTRILRLQLCEAMIKLGDNRALDEVRAALFPSRPEELEATALAIQIMGNIKDKPSQGQLVQLIDKADPQAGKMPAEVRLAAATAMAKMGQPRGGYVADEYRTSTAAPVRAQAALLYGETRHRQYVAVLEPMMADPDSLVRVAAAAGILKITDGPTGQ